MQHYSFLSRFSCGIEHVDLSSDLTVVYIHGFCSAPWGTKPDAIREYCVANNVSFLRFELAGHGSDSENYMDSDFNIWRTQVLDIIDNHVSGRVIMAGASLGGWLSLIAARERPDRVVGVLGLAPAADFTADMEKMVLSPEQLAQLNSGVLVYPTPEFTYRVTKRIVDSARENLILGGPLDIRCPVHIIHGTADRSLIPDKPFQILRALTGDIVVVKLIKGSGHRLNSDIDRMEIRASLSALFALARQG